VSAHVPALAAGDAGGPRRALLLAGGGMRVAYQAGALLALEEAGLRFTHADGTSGGIFNLAMLLSGVTPAEACERWRRLRPRGFATPPSLRVLAGGPPYPAWSSSDGLRRDVLPKLGVDPARIRAAEGIAGTFNVCDFAAKAVVAVPHERIDLDTLIAGVSLPVFSPAVRRNGSTLMDAVWIRDVNVEEAIRRGAEELWLVWCIGNHGVYRDGAFQQYVHMIEIAANASLAAQLAGVPEDVTLRVIRPRVPLPLDPDYLLGRIDGASLVAMGYRDAAELLDNGSRVSPHDASATRMSDPRPGIGLREHLRGDAGGTPLELRLDWELEDVGATQGRIAGDATHPALGVRQPAREGVFSVDGDRVRARLRFSGGTLTLERSLQRWSEVEVDTGDARGRLRACGPPAALRVHARGVGSAAAGARTQLRFWTRWLRSGS